MLDLESEGEQEEQEVGPEEEFSNNLKKLNMMMREWK